MAEHKKITFEGRSYNFDPSCHCVGCENLRKYPDTSQCDWCGKKHCGGSEHCNTQEYGTGNDICGADETISPAFERHLEGLCSVIRDRIESITNTIKENATMLPQSSGQTASRTARGQKNNSNRLRPEDLSSQAREGKILAARADLEGKYGAQVILKIAVNGEIKFWYLDIKKNPNYQLLTEKFGFDENEWVNQKILLGVEQDDFYGNYWVRVSFPENKKGGK